MIKKILRVVFGVKVDTISPEEAARIMMAKEVVFKWQPQIVEMKAGHGSWFVGRQMGVER